MWEYIQAIQKRRNITIFLTTHYLEEAEICDQLAIIDHGKLVAHDTPYNLKKRHTRTTTKIIAADLDPILRHCADRCLEYIVQDGRLTITSTEIGPVMDVVALFKDSIRDIEINKGTLDDVFLSLTGKEIRN